jgi:hypothetical protein
MRYYIKAIYAGLIGAMGSLAGSLAVVDGLAISDLPDAAWVSVALFFLAGFGGTLGWQVAPASVSASVRPPTEVPASISVTTV